MCRCSYAFPVFVIDVTLLKSSLDLDLQLLGKGVVTIDEIHVTLTNILPLVENVGSCTAPGIEVSIGRSKTSVISSLPVAILPAVVLIDCDEDGLTKLAFRDLDLCFFAF